MFRLFIVTALVIIIPTLLSAASLRDTIDIRGKTYSYGKLHVIIDSSLSNDPIEKYDSYIRLGKAIDKKIQNENIILTREQYIKIREVLDIGLKNHEYSLNTQVHKTFLGYSEEGREIFGYFKGSPRKGYNLLLAGIHGAYEYGTYETALLLIGELEKVKDQAWFIMPTLNPDGLEEYIQKGNQLSSYINGRDNAYGVDLNRNFCGSDFRLTSFEKYGQYMLTGRGSCESEKESQVIVNALSKFSFHKVISLHSAGGIIYIPDGSLSDTRIITLATKLRDILEDYDFYPDTSSQDLLQESIRNYEIDEGNSGKFPGTLENYIYERYDIPVVLLELKEHGVIEEDLKAIFSLDI